MKRLIELSRFGQQEARSILIQKLQPRVERLAYFYSVRSGSEAADLEQDIWVGILTALEGVDITIGDPVAYLMKHGKWKALESIKRRNRHKEESMEGLDGMTSQNHPESAAIGSVLLDELRSRLSETQRRLLDGQLYGLSGKEIAETVGCSPANISYHLRRIREELRLLITV